MARKILYHLGVYGVYLYSTYHTYMENCVVSQLEGCESRSKGVSVSKGSALRIRIRNVVYF